MYWDVSEGERGLEEAIGFLKLVGKGPGDLVRGALLPCRIETLTLDQMRATAQAAKATGAPVGSTVSRTRLS